MRKMEGTVPFFECSNNSSIHWLDAKCRIGRRNRTVKLESATVLTPFVAALSRIESTRRFCRLYENEKAVTALERSEKLSNSSCYSGKKPSSFPLFVECSWFFSMSDEQKLVFFSFIRIITQGDYIIRALSVFMPSSCRVAMVDLERDNEKVRFRPYWRHFVVHIP